MKEKAEKKLSERIKRCETMEEAKEKLSDGIAVLEWCGSESCGKMVEEKTDGSILGEILERRKGRCVVCRKPADKSFYLGRAY
jgi:prolyl-tRNA synthetase